MCTVPADFVRFLLLLLSAASAYQTHRCFRLSPSHSAPDWLILSEGIMTVSDGILGRVRRMGGDVSAVVFRGGLYFFGQVYIVIADS